jgi:uncharacterized protein YjbJ (UPF0337 family)
MQRNLKPFKSRRRWYRKPSSSPTIKAWRTYGEGQRPPKEDIVRKENSIMNWDQVEGKWKQMKGAVKEKWGKLTDDDLDRIAGKRDRLAGRLQECYGLHKELAEKQCDEWCNTAEDIVNKESAA